MKKLSIVTFTIVCILLMAVFSSCLYPSSRPADMKPIIDGKYKDARSVYYPSTDQKVAAIIVHKNGNVWYLRMNAAGNMRDEIRLFNVSDYCH